MVKRFQPLTAGRNNQIHSKYETSQIRNNLGLSSTTTPAAQERYKAAVFFIRACSEARAQTNIQSKACKDKSGGRTRLVRVFLVFTFMYACTIVCETYREQTTRKRVRDGHNSYFELLHARLCCTTMTQLIGTRQKRTPFTLHQDEVHL